MTPISSVYMLSVESKLDYALLKEISRSGHSCIPVYEEVDVPVSLGHVKHVRTQRVKRILGVLLAKQFISVDPRGLHSSSAR
jgi:metal transporter CNNM